MRIEFSEMDDWPPLAWLAVCVPGNAPLTVLHGSRVETSPDWFCEAVWAGNFADGDFDRTDVVMGSGARKRGEQVVFVSSGSTVDRLQSIELDGRCLVSNSLCCLLAAAKADVDPCDTGYYIRFRSIINGLDRYHRHLQTSAGRVELIYFHNLTWDGLRLSISSKPATAARFDNFDQYQTFLGDSMAAVGSNMRAAARKYPYLPLGTISTGYDSPTVAVLAKPLGLEDAVTFSKARGGAKDDGSAIAQLLKLNCVTVDRDAWRQSASGSIIPFLATNAYGEEAHYAGLGSLAMGRVLFTGYHGDKVWGKETKHAGPQIVRGDPSGLSLSEHRLSAGFIHFPLPFLGVRCLDAIRRISNSPQMQPWDLPGNYSRPIPRRIVEQAGVDRRMFGVAKRAVSLVLWNPDEQFLPPSAMADYTEWLQGAEGAWRSKGRTPPLARLGHSRLQLAVGKLARACASGLAHLPNSEPFVRRLRRLDPATQPSPLFYHLFPWAIDRAKRLYRFARQ